jgi:hypothetical protein
MGDRAFSIHCGLCAQKYCERSGKKPGTDDNSTRLWYLAMSLHAVTPSKHPDPRADRPDFVPYVEVK